METSKLRKFASFARSALIEQVGTRLKTVLAEKSMARRESPKAVEELEKRIKELGEKRVLEMVAYTWFNRFCALRYMDVNRYTRIGVLSPADGQFQPEILAEAKMGHIDEELVPEAARKQVIRLLDGSDPSTDPQGEAYRMLLVAVCNYYHAVMPFMFEKISDYTELLLPDDLLSGTSIPAYTREALLPINCSPEYTEESVEVIGWLYQFYIADKKDEVFDGMKQGKKITLENIPAATQLFTPHWIVRYLVENTLGRLWMLNHPDSKLVERMDYYIKPEELETDFLRIASPEEIKVCDPACGSGHMLTYAFDLLHEIYREEQFPEPEIPTLILKNNLFGIEIDPRAGALAAFALTMKAREKDKRYFTRKSQSDASAKDLPSTEGVKSKIQNPNICVLENIHIDKDDLSIYVDKVDRDLFTSGLQQVVTQWEEAGNLGSLIRPVVQDVGDVLELLRKRQLDQDLFLANVHHRVLLALRQADYLSPRYHVVVANPPYMGGRNMPLSVKDFLAEEYEAVKSDTFAAFMLRNLELCLQGGQLGFMTPFVWMFISSYEDLRKSIIDRATITSLVQLEYSGFDGATVPICTFTLENQLRDSYRGAYVRLSNFRGADNQGPRTLEAIRDPSCGWFYRADASNFKLIPSSPISYWVTPEVIDAFRIHDQLYECSISDGQNITANNEKYLRLHWEVDLAKIGTNEGKWAFYSKGGSYRKWFGNLEYVVDWSDEARRNYREHSSARIIPEYLRFREGITWTLITSAKNSFRFLPNYATFDKGGSSIFFNKESDLKIALLFLNCQIAAFLSKLFNATLNFQVDDVRRLPLTPAKVDIDWRKCDQLIELSEQDWNYYENSRGFQRHPILNDHLHVPLAIAYTSLRASWSNLTAHVHEIESECNAKFIATYFLQGQLDAEIAIQDITLTCNPTHRYDANKSDSELEALLLADTMRELISYAVGCMLGRYSLDKPGLILANQGETSADFRQQIPKPTFAPDEDNVIPITEREWFNDDIAERFKEFLKTALGNEHYGENLEFLENALYPDNPTAKKRKTIRDYFLKEFYDHHLKIFKKRPIYWLFSSPKGTFNALIYMHRYRSDTVSTILEYLRDFRDKLFHHSEHQQMVADSGSATKTEKTAAIKEVAVIKKQLKELEDYEKVLFDVASKKIEIDLDNGVKHNYPLFGSVLKKIAGLDAKED